MIQISRIIHQSLQLLLVVHSQKKEERKRQVQQENQTHNLLLSIVVFVCELYLFCVEESKHHAYC